MEKQSKPKRTSAVISEVVKQCAEDGTVTVGEFLGLMGRKAMALAILVFAIAAVIAGIVPGFSTIIAVPIMYIAAQIALGHTTINLPRSVRKKEISPKVMREALTKSMSTLQWIERFMRPRLTFLTGGICLRFIAVMIMVLAGVLALPIPGGNFLPSFTITLLAFAILERDGLFLILTLCTIYFTGALMVDLIETAFRLLSQWVGF